MTLLGSEHSILIRSKFRSVLQLRLQQRRTREQLADQGVMPLNHGKLPKQEDSYAFEGDSSSESLSPEQPLSEESQGSAAPATESKGSGSPCPELPSPAQASLSRDTASQSQADGAPLTKGQASPPIPVPAIVKSKTSDKNRHKKPKDIKPKVKKLKYHQYIPPDQKAEKSPPPMDSAYARLLQQQQLFLQLQILSQQKQQQQHQQQPQSFSYQPPPPPPHHHTPVKQSGEQHSACLSSAPTSTVSSTSSSPVKTSYCSPTSIPPVRPGPLPPNLDDLKVSELRQQLRVRGLPVSGTKTALIERLRPFKDPNSSSPSSSGDITTVTFPVTPTGSLSSYQSPSSTGAVSHGGYYPYCSTSSTPPISPASSDLSVPGSLPDSFSDVAMSSPQFGLQGSPAQPGTDEAQVGAPCGDPRTRPEAPEAEKDKMLVEKQKVIEELTWKLHQEQRQVEELRMQLHKRKRAHAPPEPHLGPPGPPQPFHHLQPPSQMQHFFDISIKQEHVAPTCPFSKPLKGSPPTSCMESMAHCSLAGGPRCLEVPASATSVSPSAASAFLSPQCSPQDSPVTKNSSSPQPSPPGHPYLLSPCLGRDGCTHQLPQSGSRPHSMQIQQKTISQSMSCPYSSEQRGMQPVYPGHDNSLHLRGPAKTKGHVQQKMPISHSPRHMGQTRPTSSSTSSSSSSSSGSSPASEIKQPPRYEDAVKQQMNRSQQMDELLDVLIESGEMPASAKEESSVTKVVPHLTVSPGSAGCVPIPKLQHRLYGALPSPQLPFEHAASHGDCHLEALLSGPVIRQGDVVLMKLGAEDGHLEEGESFAGAHHDDKLLCNREMMDTRLSPLATKVASGAADGQGLGMTFVESPWETMEWLDLTPPSSATAFTSVPPSGPSIFNTEFLDVTDINLNSAMDLHLEHW